MDKKRVKLILMDLLQNDEDVQWAVKEALGTQQNRDEWAEARAWT